jgi:hypothetical protein
MRPSGPSIDPNSGAFTWTPTAGQAPGPHSVTIRVTDDGVPALFDEETIQIAVNAAANTAPTLNFIANQIVTVGQTPQFTATAADAEAPPQTLRFSLEDGTGQVPTGAAIDANTGAFSWTPAAAGSATFDVVVRDRGRRSWRTGRRSKSPSTRRGRMRRRSFRHHIISMARPFAVRWAGPSGFLRSRLLIAISRARHCVDARLPSGRDPRPTDPTRSGDPTIFLNTECGGTFRFVVMVTDSADQSDSCEFFIKVI